MAWGKDILCMGPQKGKLRQALSPGPPAPPRGLALWLPVAQSGRGLIPCSRNLSPQPPAGTLSLNRQGGEGAGAACQAG